MFVSLLVSGDVSIEERKREWALVEIVGVSQ
jgi:hypothetical protein